MIDRKSLEARRTVLERQKELATAQLNQLHGAIQVIEQLLVSVEATSSVSESNTTNHQFAESRG